MEIKKQTENKLLARKEVLISSMSEGSTVSRNKVKSELAKKFKVEEGQIIINSIKPVYGSLNVEIDAVIYDKAETAKKVTSSHMLKRNGIEVSKKAVKKEA